MQPITSCCQNSSRLRPPNPAGLAYGMVSIKDRHRRRHSHVGATFFCKMKPCAAKPPQHRQTDRQTGPTWYTASGLSGSHLHFYFRGRFLRPG
jgi:hypothetical protein